MDLETSIRKIKEIYYTLHGKDTDVLLRYVGTSHGVTQPWNLIIDSYQTKGETWQKPIEAMMKIFKQDLEAKIKMAEFQAATFQKTLNQIAMD